MNYWMIALPREDMEHCVKIGAFGMNRKQGIGKVRADDKVACYVTKESRIIAIGEVTASYYMDTKKIFKAEGLFPDRFNFKADLLGAQREIDFKTLVDDLQFITNKFYWTVYLRSGIAQIPEHDWNLVQSKASLARK